MKLGKGLGLVAGTAAGIVISATGYTIVADDEQPSSAGGHSHATDSDEASPAQTGPVQVVATGSADGTGWVLQANESSAGLCVEILVESIGQNSGGACGFGLIGESRSQDEVVGLGQFWSTDPDVSFAYGPIADIGAQFVDIVTDEGTRRGEVVPGPEGLKFDLYVVALGPTESGERVTALADGRELGARAVDPSRPTLLNS